MGPIGRDRPRRLPWGVVPLLFLLLIGGVQVDQWWGDRSVPQAIGGETLEYAPGDPIRLVVPKVQIDAKVTPIAMEGRVLTPPDAADLVGWWDESAKPAATKGQTLLTGHTWHRGGGVMDDLGKVEKGDDVQVHTDGEEIHYKVTGIETMSRAEVAENAKDLWGQGVHHRRLVLVTCTDWNGREFESNIVVFAELA